MNNSTTDYNNTARDTTTIFFGGGLSAELTGEDGALRKCPVDIFSERASMRRERQGAAIGLVVSGLNHVAYKMQGNATEYANDKGKKKGAANTTAKGDVLNWHDQEDSPGLYHYAENSEVKDGILEIHAHGNPNSIGGFKDISKLGLTLYESSPSWRNFINNGKELTLKLYSCRTGTPGGIAQKISSYYPELIVKAPGK